MCINLKHTFRNCKFFSLFQQSWKREKKPFATFHTCSQVGMYKRKQENKNSTKKVIKNKKKERKQELDQESNQEKKEKTFFKSSIFAIITF